MKSLKRIGTFPAQLQLSADDIVEFHAARLLLLFEIVGVNGHIDSLTKMAKLDFFVRYPEFYEVARDVVLKIEDNDDSDQNKKRDVVESAMVRHHYGPWDHRYYHVLSFLESRNLVKVSKVGTQIRFQLTQDGRNHALSLAACPSFEPLVERLRDVKKVFGNKTGFWLKKLIYDLFDIEVGQRGYGEVIRR